MRQIDEYGQCTKESTEYQTQRYNKNTPPDILSPCFCCWKIAHGSHSQSQLIEHLSGCINPNRIISQEFPLGLEEEDDAFESSFKEKSSEHQDEKDNEGCWGSHNDDFSWCFGSIFDD